MKKKLLALMLAMVMMLSLSVTAFASSDTTDPDSTTEETTEEEGEEEEEEVTVTSSPTVVKVVSGDNAPDETYSFTVTATGYTNAPSSVTEQPEVTVSSISNSGSAELDLSAITEIGIYTYTIAEVTPTVKTAGMSYDTTTYTLKVTAYLDDNGELQKAVAIYSGSEKVESAKFTNTYTANTLTVTKKVTGNLGDDTKEFSFTVTFTNADSETISWINKITATASGVTITAGDNNTYTFTLKAGASAVFTNIPSGISYTVVENSANQDGYTTSYDANQNGTMAGSDITTTVTNDKDQTVDTGISLDSLPYILMLIVVAAGVVVMISRRRLNDRF